MRLTWERAAPLIELTRGDCGRGGTPGCLHVAKVGVVLSGGNVNLDRLPW